MNIFTYTGTEQNLYELLVWWQKMVPFVHTDDCTDDPNMLHCCEGKSGLSNALIGAVGRPTKHGEPCPVYFAFLQGKRAGMRYDLSPGDKILFEDGKFSYLESFECVAISQDWP